MPTRRFLWALASICISAALVVAPIYAAARSKRAEEEQRAIDSAATYAELELALAQTKRLYLVLRPAVKALEIRSRGVTLDRVSLMAVDVLDYERSFRPESDGPSVPFAWVVAEEPDGSHRKLIAPAELKPYEEYSAEEEQGAAVPMATAPAQAEPLPTPPSEYHIDLDGGWQLHMLTREPSTSLWSRLKYALRDGWLRLRGEKPPTPHLLVLAGSPEQTQKLYHLFRAGTRLLLDDSPE